MFTSFTRTNTCSTLNKRRNTGVSREKRQGGGVFFGFLSEASENKNPTPWGFS